MLGELASQTLAHDEAKRLQDAAYTVFQSRDLRHQLGADHQQRPNRLAVKALYSNFTIPTDPYDLRNAFRVVVIRLVDLERQRRPGVARIDADDGQTTFLKAVIEPRQ
jgi:hypothetical protein